MTFHVVRLTTIAGLLNVDAPGGVLLLDLGDHHAQNTILQASFGILRDRLWEAEAPLERAHASLGDPVGVLRFGLCNFCQASRGDLLALQFLALRWCSFTFLDFCSSCGPLTLLVPVLGAAFDDKGLLIGEFDCDVALVNARKFSFEGIRVFRLLDIELWRKICLSGQIVRQALQLADGVIEEIVEWAEFLAHWREGGRSREEERHVGFLS